MKNIVGQAVRKKDFWNRNDIVDDLKSIIDSGSHILMSAPRRVGKTSIMYHLLDSADENTIALYVATESADSQNEFWKKLFHALSDEEFVNKLTLISQSIVQKFKALKISKISSSGVEFGNGEQLDYKQAFIKTITSLELNKKIIIMIDEFAQTIENIREFESDQAALKLLKDHRDIRQNIKISNLVTFIYAGSIGLESVVANLNASKHINDLNSIKITPLNNLDAQKFCSHLLAEHNISINQESLGYLLKIIEWLIPFYIQLLVQESRKLCRDTKEIDQTIIDQALLNALDHRNHFESWFIKVKTTFKSSSYLYAKEILNTTAQNETMTSLEISNIAAKHDLDEDQAKAVMNTLKYDGYINNNDDITIYRFNSPILRLWWNKHVAH